MALRAVFRWTQPPPRLPEGGGSFSLWDMDMDATATDATAAPSQPVIRRLSPRLINQIAAGEVITRPAAAVKELVENAFDAGAGRIEITVEDDALSFTVRDDGCGMGADDLLLSVERHATSKIRELDDLMRLSTRGFRGEALAAIAAVSRLEIVTRRPADREGLRLRVSGGKELRVGACAANPGTMIAVRDLFFNTPARLKFLKSAVAEWGHILQALLRQALTRPDVAFAIRWRGRPYLDLPANQPLCDRLAQILPGDGGGPLLAVDHMLQDVRVHGAISHPSATRRDRRYQFFFANGRPILHRPLPFALEEAYRGLLMTQRYPLAALLIELPGELVDVNVHPTKEEVRFREEGLVTGAVHRAAATALRAANLLPTLMVPAPALKPLAPRERDAQPPPMATAAGETAQPPTLLPDALPPPAAPPTTRQLDFVAGFGLERAGDRNEESTKPPAPGAPGTSYYPMAGAATEERVESGLLERLRALGEPPRVLAQVSECYIVADAGLEGLLVVDQHAAHEKIMYLKYMRAAEGRGLAIQPLLLPHALELGPAEAAALEPLLPALAEAGFEVEPFGGGSYIVQAVPTIFDGLDIEAFMRDLLDDVGQGDLPRELQRLRERICARAACRAAVKAGDRLGREEMQRLVDQLLGTHELLRCPHGRPTALLLTREQIDRQFGRLG